MCITILPISSSCGGLVPGHLNWEECKVLHECIIHPITGGKVLPNSDGVSPILLMIWNSWLLPCLCKRKPRLCPHINHRMLLTSSELVRSGFSSGFFSGFTLGKSFRKPRPSLLWWGEYYIISYYIGTCYDYVDFQSTAVFALTSIPQKHRI